MIHRAKRCPAVLCLLVLFFLLPPAALGADRAPTDENQQLDHLFAFARLYGYVRYFHPSDEASRVDWDRFAVHGVERVASAKTEEELKQILEELFLPVAPMLRLCAGSPPAPCPAPTFTPKQMAGKVLAWQHVGVQGSSVQGTSIYRSARTGRAPVPAAGSFGGLGQSVSAVPLRGKTIRIRAAVRASVQGSGNAAQVWGRVDRPNRQTGWFYNMDDRPITDPQWKEYEICGPVADDADHLAFGCFVKGTGEARVDAWRVEVQTANGTWEEVQISNPDFEEAGDRIEGWFPIGPGGYSLALAADAEVHSGQRSACIRAGTAAPAGQLFSEKPGLGEVIDRRLSKGLRVMVPLALPDPPSSGDGERLKSLITKLAAIDLDQTTASDRSVRLAAIVIAWNVFQHFFPYFDVVGADWPAEFRRAAAKALADTGPEDFYVTLATMTAALKDGHVNVFSEHVPRLLPAVRFEFVEEAVVVTASEDPQIKPGDIVIAVNGRKAAEYLDGLERLISGSPQWKRWKAMAYQFGSGPPKSTITLLLKRGGEELLVTTRLTRETPFQPEEPRPAIDQLSPGILYVDMRRAKMAQIQEHMKELAAARGVIFDMRGYPTDNHAIVCHLTDTRLESAIWRVPRTIYPDHEKPAGFDTSGRWTLEPQKPRLRKAVFLTSAGAISYAESIMGIVEHYRLGQIVGEPTAGTNGNVNSIRLPGRFGVSWTGMRVIKHDGSQHHLVGIRPTVPVQRTLRAVREGRDEVLAKAIELLQDGPAKE